MRHDEDAIQVKTAPGQRGAEPHHTLGDSLQCLSSQETGFRDENPSDLSTSEDDPTDSYWSSQSSDDSESSSSEDSLPETPSPLPSPEPQTPSSPFTSLPLPASEFCQGDLPAQQSDAEMFLPSPLSKPRRTTVLPLARIDRGMPAVATSARQMRYYHKHLKGQWFLSPSIPWELVTDACDSALRRETSEVTLHDQCSKLSRKLKFAESSSCLEEAYVNVLHLRDRLWAEYMVLEYVDSNHLAISDQANRQTVLQLLVTCIMQLSTSIHRAVKFAPSIPFSPPKEELARLRKTRLSQYSCDHLILLIQQYLRPLQPALPDYKLFLSAFDEARSATILS